MSDIDSFFNDTIVSFKKRPELLLHPNVPKPLHGIAPRVIMGKKWWDKKRREAYAKNDYHCFACGVSAPYDVINKRFDNEQGLKLHAHEVYKIDYENFTVELEEIVALCPNCHDYIHCGRLNSLYDDGKLDEEDCWIIYNHGNSVLDASDFPRGGKPDTYNYEYSWKNWRLILNGKEYKSLYENEQELVKHYKGGED